MNGKGKARDIPLPIQGNFPGGQAFATLAIACRRAGPGFAGPGVHLSGAAGNAEAYPPH